MQVTPYVSLDDKKKYFSPILKNRNDFYEINSKEDFEFLYNSEDFNKSDNIYRGVNEAKFKLFTSIQRTFIEGRISTNETIPSFIKKEILAIESNKILNDYFKTIGIPITDFLYLSFLQHNSAPTTFLDFSHNKDKALYFATENVKYGNGNLTPCIDEYFSVYWINLKECQKELIHVIDLYKDGYLSGIEKIIDTKNKDEIDASNLLDLKEYLSWYSIDNAEGGLSKLNLGFIDSDNKTKHFPIGDINTASSQIKHFVKIAFKSYTKNNKENLGSIVNRMFKEVIKIVNLNLIAQEGCFLHYIPEKDINMSLEEYFQQKNIKIHCANIHKSLVPYIIQKNIKNKITLETIYPDTRNIAKKVYNDSIVNM